MKVLIVDDEVIVKKSLEKAFQLSNHNVIATTSGIEGLNLWRESTFDLVILDVLIPDMAGPEILKSRGKNTSFVVLISAYKGQYDTESAKSLGADMFIDKPFSSIIDFVKRVEEGFNAREKSNKNSKG